MKSLKKKDCDFLLRKNGWTERQSVPRVSMNDILHFEDLLTLKFLLYGMHIMDEIFLANLLEKNVQKYETVVRLLRYSNHICHMDTNNAVFQ